MVAEHLGYFSQWCAERGLEALPAEALTVGLYLTDKAVGWRLATVKKARAVIGQVHRDGGHLDPTKSPLVTDVIKALGQKKKGEARHQVDPLRTEPLAQLCRVGTAARGARHEMSVLRAQIAAVVLRCYDVTAGRLVRVGAGAIVLDDERLALSVPGIRWRWGTSGPSTEVVIGADRDRWTLRPRVARLLALVPETARVAPFCLRRTGPEALTSEHNAATVIAGQLAGAARRAGLAHGGSTADWLRALDDGAFLRLLAHCDRYHTLDLRNRALVAVSFALALRPCEARALSVAQVLRSGDAFDVTLERAKRPKVVDKRVEHWPGCPPPCPACLLGAWLGESGLVDGALFPSFVRAGRGVTMTDGDHHYIYRTMCERAGASGRHPPKTPRSGIATSLMEAGAETEEIIEVTDHTTPDVVRAHYLLTAQAARHHLGEHLTGRGA